MQKANLKHTGRGRPFQHKHQVTEPTSRAHDIQLDYQASHAIAGPLHTPIADSQPVEFRNTLTSSQQRILRGFVALNVLVTVAFLGWLIAPSHIPDGNGGYGDIGVVAGMAAFALLVILELARMSQNLVLCLFASKMKDPLPLSPQTGMRIAVLTTIVPSKEPVELVTETLAAMRRIRYQGQVDVWILDEGDDPEVRRVARRLGVHHFTRKGRPEYNQPSGEFRAKSKAGNHNAWRAENEHKYDIIAQMDPDHVPLPEFLERTVGYFRDPDVAFVVAPQVYGNLEESFVAQGSADQSYLFHGVIQRGGNGLGAPLLIGTNHLYRAGALHQIGGYQDSVIEDHLTSLTLHTTENPETGNRWKGIYTPDILAVGEGPVGWTDYFNQQQRWAYGIWDIVRSASWRMLRQLRWPQRLAYIGLQSFYPSVGVIWFGGSVLTAMYLFFGITAIHLELSTWLLFWLPTVLSQFALFFWLRRFNLVPHERKMRGSMHGLALSLAAGPIYVAAGVSSLLRKPLVYVVTAKSSLASPDSYKTFRFHLSWAAGAILSLFASGALENNHWPLRAWAMVTVAAVLFPVVVFSVGRYKALVMDTSLLPSLPAARFAAAAMPVLLVLLVGLSTTAAFNTISEPTPVPGPIQEQTTQAPASAQVGSAPLVSANNGGRSIENDPLATSPLPEAAPRPEKALMPPGVDSEQIMYGSFQADAGSSPGDLSHVYYEWSEQAGSFAGFVDFSAEQGQVAVISWEPRLNPIQAEADPVDVQLLAGIAAGEHDAYIRSVALALGGTQTPVIIRFAFEMDLEANGLHPWGGQDPETFVAAYRQVVDLFREEGADNVRWLWSPSAMTDDEGRLSSIPYYPGAEYVDYTGFSAFLYWRWEEWSDERAMNHTYRTPSEYLTGPVQDLSALGHPIIIPELGVDLHPSLPEYKKEQWLAQLALALTAGSFPDVVGVMYFNSEHNWDDREADWRLTPRERETLFGMLSGRQTSALDALR